MAVEKNLEIEVDGDKYKQMDERGVGGECNMLPEVKRRKLRLYGHWKRRGGSIAWASIEGEIEGRGKRGRKRTDWIINILEWEGVEHAHSREWNRMSTTPNWTDCIHTYITTLMTQRQHIFIIIIARKRN